jgi:hypothetical protein
MKSKMKATLTTTALTIAAHAHGFTDIGAAANAGNLEKLFASKPPHTDGHSADPQGG